MKQSYWVSLWVFLSLTACDLCAGEGCEDAPDGCAALNADGCEVDPRCTELLAQPLLGEAMRILYKSDLEETPCYESISDVLA